jgi:peptidyl-prolyl cis-trans isomerase SurA
MPINSSRPALRVAMLAVALGVGSRTARAQQATPTTFDRVVAVAGEQPLLLSEIEEELLRRRADNPKFVIPTDSVELNKLRRDILTDLIDEQLLLQKAKSEKIEVSDADLVPQIDARVQKVRAQFTTDAEYRTKLAEAGFGTPEEYRALLLDRARRGATIDRLIAKLREENKFSAPPVNDSALARYFAEGKLGEQHRPPQIAFRQLIVTPVPRVEERARARAKIDSILAEIRKGGDFEQAAKRFSEDPGTKELGGDLGWNHRGNMVAEFDAVMFALPPGRVSNVVETTYGYHIIRVDRVQPAEVKARHILIRWPVDSTDVSLARAKADSVVRALRAGASLDSLAAIYKDPVEQRTVPLFPVAELPAAYQAALAGRKVGDIVEPFALPDPTYGSKFSILKVSDYVPEGDLTLADVKTQLRTVLSEEGARKRLIATLRKEMFVSVRI